MSEAKPILPFRIEDVTLSKHMRCFIGTPHWLDALTPPLERHLQRMVETVSALIHSLVIHSLENKSGEKPPIPAADPPLFVSPPSPALAAPAAPAWNAGLLAKIEAELRTFIGLFGSVPVQETVTKTSDYQDLCRRLADSILSQQERQAFLEKCAALAPAAVAPPPTSGISAEVQAAAEKALASYIGPLARVLAKRAARDASSPAEFYRLLAEQIASPAGKSEFLRYVQR